MIGFSLDSSIYPLQSRTGQVSDPGGLRRGPGTDHVSCSDPPTLRRFGAGHNCTRNPGCTPIVSLPSTALISAERRRGLGVGGRSRIARESLSVTFHRYVVYSSVGMIISERAAAANRRGVMGFSRFLGGIQIRPGNYAWRPSTALGPRIICHGVGTPTRTRSKIAFLEPIAVLAPVVLSPGGSL